MINSSVIKVIFYSLDFTDPDRAFLIFQENLYLFKYTVPKTDFKWKCYLKSWKAWTKTKPPLKWSQKGKITFSSQLLQDKNSDPPSRKMKDGVYLQYVEHCLSRIVEFSMLKSLLLKSTLSVLHVSHLLTMAFNVIMWPSYVMYPVFHILPSIMWPSLEPRIHTYFSMAHGTHITCSEMAIGFISK